VFFYLSKIVTFIIDPLFWILIFCFLCLLLTRGRWKFKRYGYLLFIVFYLISTPAVANRLFYILEHLEVPSPLAIHYDAVVVLTGMADLEKSSTENVEFSSAVDRILAGISFIKEGRAKYLIITGGEGALVRKNRSEAVVLGEFAKRFGVKPDRILIEPKSRNTFENAVNTADLLRHQKINKVLLVTSAFHMFRSLGCFRQVGLKVDIYPVDYSAGKEIADFRAFLPSSNALSKTRIMIHEAVGIIMYGFTGKADYRILN
jgi:uncharacterized SAM-binding protein YcdF (DUF218 family)